jgi:predicted acylesterase/phospholipase RssA
MVHDVALVLGGGGAAGQAWQIGVIAGLAEAGLDLTEAADLVAGTSSGSTTAAQVRSGIPAAELLASVLSPPVQPVGQRLRTRTRGGTAARNGRRPVASRWMAGPADDRGGR